MTLTTIIGSVAALCTTVALLPQAIQTIRTRATDGLSLPTYLLLFVGTVLWGAYALLIKDVPILITNVISLILSSIILYLKLTTKPGGPRPGGRGLNRGATPGKSPLKIPGKVPKNLLFISSGF